MTGAFRTRDAVPLTLASSASRSEAEDWPPRFAKIVIRADTGAELAMTNKRRLGRIRLRADPLHERPVSELGFDPWLDPPRPGEFVRLLARRTVTLKGLLLDQSFAAGVGNWIADEVLYQARLDPRTRACDVDPRDARRLLARLIGIVRRAVEVDACKDRFPRTWLFHRRWGKAEGARTVRGERIEFLTVAGRTTAWVPSRQGAGTRAAVPRRRTLVTGSRP
jgi:formamidopyrimidine-DNA glycosylase